MTDSLLLACFLLPGYKKKKGMCRCGKKRSLEIPETNSNNNNKRTESRFTFTSALRKKICGCHAGIEQKIEVHVNHLSVKG